MDTLHDLEELALTFLRAMSLSLVPTVSETEDTVRVDLAGPDAYLLLERKGSVLDALQLILGKVAESRLGLDKRLVLDCDGYRRGRERELVEIALGAAERVRKFRQPFELAPMNPYERRLVHLALSEEGDVSAQSEGEGFLKRIIISPV